MLKRFNSAINKYGAGGTIKKLPAFIRSRIRRFASYPSPLTRFGVAKSKWQKFQINHELGFWLNYKKSGSSNNAGTNSIDERKNQLTNRFNTKVHTNFDEKIVLDVGCGPFGGFLPHVNAKTKIGIEPLAREFQKLYPVDPDIITISAMAEDIPLLSESVDACYCINMLDHTMKPYEAMEEIYRILKPGGYLAFAVDVGGAKQHPVKIYKKDLDAFFNNHRFDVIEQNYSAEKSHWGKDAEIPVYTFQGYKR